MKKILLTTIAVAAFAQGASALEAGKMYARGDLGYQFSSLKVTGDKSSRLKGFAGDIGFGYALSDSVRTDVTLNFARPTKSSTGNKLAAAEYNTEVTKYKIKDAKVAKDGSEVTKKVKAKEKSMGLMFNAYYDFNNASEFTPYVMAGFGVSRNSLELKTTANLTAIDKEGKDEAVTQNLLTIKSKNKTSFAYQVGVGAAYEMSKDIHLDVGYKLSGITGKYKSKDTKAGDNVVIEGVSDWVKPKLSHTLTAGVRFAF
jgi:opacity protein-like surface antigen